MTTGYRALLETLPADVSWEVGDDEDNPGRFYAAARWDDHVAKVHRSIKIVNERTLESAVKELVVTVETERFRT